MERIDNGSRFDQRRDPAFDRGDGHDLRLREIVAARRHEPRDGSSRRNAAQAVGIGFFRASTPRRPFRNDPQTSSEALALQAPPKFATVSSAGLPLGVEPFEIRLQGALTRPEDVRTLAPQHPTHEAPAVARVAHPRRLWRARGSRRWRPRVSGNPHIGAVRRQSAIGIDDRRAHDGANLAHRFAHGVQKGVAGVFHEMPAIGDLLGRRERL